MSYYELAKPLQMWSTICQDAPRPQQQRSVKQGTLVVEYEVSGYTNRVLMRVVEGQDKGYERHGYKDEVVPVSALVLLAREA